MSGNTFGTLFTVTTFGESHGPASAASSTAARRAWRSTRPTSSGSSTGAGPAVAARTQRREPDTVEILSGVFEGRTTGAPIALLIRNEDQRSKDYANIADTFRPGHADYTYWQKYGIRDYRGGGRSSARETAVRVAAGAIAQEVAARALRRGDPRPPDAARADRVAVRGLGAVDANPFFVANATIVPELEAFMDALRKSGDSSARGSRWSPGRPGRLGRAGYDRSMPTSPQR